MCVGGGGANLFLCSDFFLVFGGWQLLTKKLKIPKVFVILCLPNEHLKVLRNLASNWI